MILKTIISMIFFVLTGLIIIYLLLLFLVRRFYIMGSSKGEMIDLSQRKNDLLLVIDVSNYPWFCQTTEPHTLTEFVRDFKKYTAKTILKKIWDEPESRRSWILGALREAGKYDNRITNYKFWQEGCHPIQLHSNEMIDQRINYVHNNPVRALIVRNPEDYLYSSARNYASLDGIIEV